MVGKSLGHYEVLGTLGSGGMGDVYFAEDTRLGRNVALKVLPKEFVADSQRCARFEQEAKLLAALNHINIATIYGFEQVDGVPFIAMELVEGETLERRLAGGEALGEQEALEIARQVADGLGAAHAKGIVHRDLKPANVMITPSGIAKVLDFGIATSQRDAQLGGAEATALTTAGTILGTPQYMSPEQVRGDAIDRRTDIWAFGCVLFALLAGKAPFARATVADTLAAIIDQEPDWDLLSPASMDLVGALLRRCLRKELDHRLHDIADARIEIEEMLGPVPGRRPSMRRLWRPSRPISLRHSVIGAVIIVAAGWSLWSGGDRLWGSRPLPAAQAYRVTTGEPWESQPAISPDGTRIAFSVNLDGSPDIYLVDAHGGEPVALVEHPASDMNPAWFPDGSVAFASDRDGSLSIWKVSQFGGGATLLLSNAGDPAISPDGSRVAFTRPSSHGQSRIGVAAVDDPASATIITTDDGGFWDHTAPAWSPDGLEICYASRDGLRLVPAGGGEPRPLTTGGHFDTTPSWSFDGRYVYFSSNRGGSQAVWRVRSDAGSPPERVTMGMGPESYPSLSHDGRVLAYASGTTQRELVLLDRHTGNETPLSNLPDDFFPAIAPDASKVVYVSRRWGLAPDLWVQPLREGAPSAAPSRLAEISGVPSHPSFSPDGRWIAYYRILGEDRDVFVIPAAGGAPVAFTEDSGQNYQPAWARDGTQLAFVSERSGSQQIWSAPFKDGRRAGTARQLTHETASIDTPVWSPDGRLIAYVRFEGDNKDVWVIPAAGGASPRQVTFGAHAARVRWDSTGEHLLVSGEWGNPSELTMRRVSPHDGETEELRPAVRFGSGFGIFDLSFDGGFLVYSRGAREGDIWVLRAESGIY